MKKFLPFFAVLMMSAPAAASVLSVSSPDVEMGEWSIETGLSWERDDRQDDFREYVLEIGYSPTDYWNTALEFSVEDNNGDAEYAVTAWKNTLQFIEQRDGVPLSAGLRLQYERARLDDEADEIAARLLFRHQNDIIDTRLNIGAEREVGSDAENDFTGDIRASVRYKWSEKFRPAIDYLGDTGSLHSLQSFKNQDHRIGPVIYGSFDNVSYEAG